MELHNLSVVLLGIYSEALQLLVHADMGWIASEEARGLILGNPDSPDV